MTTVVLKFGGTNVKTVAGFRRIASIISDRKKVFSKIVVVVNSLEEVTDSLLAEAQTMHTCAGQKEMEKLFAATENISSAFLAMALQKVHLDAVSFHFQQAGIVTCSSAKNSPIIDVQPKELMLALEKGQIAIIAGIENRANDRIRNTFGQASTDVTAVALAISLQAKKVEFYKDISLHCAQKNVLTYNEIKALAEKGCQVLHERCIALAQTARMPLHLLSYEEPCLVEDQAVGTWIYENSRIKTSNKKRRKNAFRRFCSRL